MCNIMVFSPMASRQLGGWPEKVCPGCISETLRCRKLKLGMDIGKWCRCVTSWWDFDMVCHSDLEFEVLQDLGS